MSGSSGALVALDIGGTTIKGVVTSAEGERGEVRRWLTPAGPDTALSGVLAALQERHAAALSR